MGPNEQELDARLGRYAALAASLLASGQIQAQIVHRDIEDVTFSGQTQRHGIDFDEDGQDDFALDYLVQDQTPAYVGLRLFTKPGDNVEFNSALGSLSASGSYFYPFALDAGQPIGSQQAAWRGDVNNGNLTMMWSYLAGGTYGNWMGTNSKYLGVRFKKQGATHYGWMRLDVEEDGSSVTLYEWAYNAAAGEAMFAGQQNVTASQEVQSKDFWLAQHDGRLELNFLQVPAPGSMLRVFNLAGQLLLEEELRGQAHALELRQPAGMYLLQVRREQRVDVLRVGLP